MTRYGSVLLCCALLHSALALYPSSSDVVELTPSNFDRLVKQSDNVWVVEFYAPWCGHCKNLVPEYSKAATALKGVVKVGAVNADEHQSLAQEFKVQGFPTLKIFGHNKNAPEDYNGGRTAADFVDGALKAAKSKVEAQLGKKTGKSSDSSDVVTLTDANFDSLVLDSEDVWLVEFYAPWCGHCKNLEPQWAKAASELRGKVKLGALDATVHSSKAAEYGVKGYPTIKVFGAGKKSRNSAEDYNGGRTASDIITFALDLHSDSVQPPEIVQIINEKTLKDCGDKALCVVSVLPHILDCDSNCRNTYISTLVKLGDKYKKKLWGWAWAEAGAQPPLENALEIGGFGYPAMAVVNVKKMKYSLLRGSFSEQGINEFLRDLSFGRGQTAPVKGGAIPAVNDNEPWDGKDGELPVEEDIDLSDVELDKDEL